MDDGITGKKRLIETEEEKDQLIEQCHRNEKVGHPGYKEMLRQIAEVAFWDVMRKDILKCVSECPECQLERESRKTGLREEVSRPEEVWQQVSIDHITKLPRTGGKDSILVIQDQFSGMIHLKAVTEKESAAKVWQDCKETVWKLHGYPREIRTDRGTVFTSRSWKEFQEREGINQNKTTAYHPQANGQVERANREVKKYLRKYVNENQNNWPELLSMIEYVLNTRKPDGRTYISYQIIYGETSAITATKRQRETQFRERMQKEAGNPTKEHPASDYKKGDWVYFKRKRGRKDRSSASLDHK